VIASSAAAVNLLLFEMVLSFPLPSTAATGTSLMEKEGEEGGVASSGCDGSVNSVGGKKSDMRPEIGEGGSGREDKSEDESLEDESPEDESLEDESLLSIVAE